MKPMVRTPLARIWIATASAISESFCGVLKTHLVLASVGRMIAADAASEIIGTSASATTSRIARELGVTVDPTTTSTLFSVLIISSVGDSHRGDRRAARCYGALETSAWLPRADRLGVRWMRRILASG